MALHPVLRKNMNRTILAAYDNMDSKTPGDLREYIRRLIRTRRTVYRCSESSIDRLLYKSIKYGNKGGWGKAKVRELAKVIYDHKTPDATIAFGDALSVEIECFFLSQDAENSFVCAMRKAGLSKHVTVKNDGSLHWRHNGDDEPCCTNDDGEEIECDCPKPYGREVVVTFTPNTKEILITVCRELNLVKAKVNKTCGLHVHFDCRHLEKRNVTALANRVARCVPALKEMLPKSRRNNSFCRANVNNFKTCGDRYSFVNVGAYLRHKTLEIRGHSGTTDAIKILNWIEIITIIMKKRNSKVIEKIETLLFVFPFSSYLKEYIKQRHLKFNPVVDVTANNPEFDDVANDNNQEQVTA